MLVVSKGSNALESLAEFIQFLAGEFNLESKQVQNEVDQLLQQTTLTVEKVFNNIANGVYC
ncbi:hypothetical protein MWH25_08900 [Natroniella acetigena]|uniref:hypothetical protein n=1 Tax=Natroniella acetigena TaxID=52004 RepID=UPI00200A18DC|nr:hypothetical protein [Natroniella acetigena]MCK8827857.1 hypothetical protein [Natroniella acetigena]